METMTNADLIPIWERMTSTVKVEVATGGRSSSGPADPRPGTEKVYKKFTKYYLTNTEFYGIIKTQRKRRMKKCIK